MTAAFNLPYVARSCMTVALVCVLAACGQRGPLYLPKPITSSTPTKPISAPAAESTTAFPATPAAQTPAKPADSSKTDSEK